VIVTRARKLVISHVFTPANYEYCVYWILHQDGTIQLEIKLTGILSTYSMNPDEDTLGWGTQVSAGVNAHNHQHMFCMRIDPRIDGSENTVFQVDAVRGPGEAGSEENPYGNAFYAKRTKFNTVQESISDYDGTTTRTWDMANTNVLNPSSQKPVSYKLVSRETPPLLPRPGGIVYKRAGFARHSIHVTPYSDDQLHPAGRHVPQTSGEPSKGLPEWIETASLSSEKANIDNTDVVVWHTFGVNHFPAPEDFPIMPAEPMSVLLRPRNFFSRNPCLDVKPSYCSMPSEILKLKEGKAGQVLNDADKTSKLAFSNGNGSSHADVTSNCPC
jgi:primary-amine oxidase